jgi:hypothetical protein
MLAQFGTKARPLLACPRFFIGENFELKKSPLILDFLRKAKSTLLRNNGFSSQARRTIFRIPGIKLISKYDSQFRLLAMIKFRNLLNPCFHPAMSTSSHDQASSYTSHNLFLHGSSVSDCKQQSILS